MASSSSSNAADAGTPGAPVSQHLQRTQQLAAPPADPPASQVQAHRNIMRKTTKAKTVGSHDPMALKSQKHITTELIGDVKITFDMKYERKRARGKTLPRMLYRTAYENSATMSQFVTPDCLVKHRDVPELKLHEQNAFQNVGNFIATRDMTRLRIERQFKTQQKVDPSPFVSMYDSFPEAEKRARLQYNESRLVGHRVYIAEIDTTNLIAGTLRGEEQVVEAFYAEGSLTKLKEAVETRSVRIPVWIRKTARPDPLTKSITIQEFYNSGADMYVSVPELRVSDIVVRASPNRDNEWLSCGPVPMSAIGRVMPFDGRTVHREKSRDIIQSRQSIETYVFDWQKRMWRHNPDMSDISHFRLELVGDKRKLRKEENIDEVLALVKTHLMRPDENELEEETAQEDEDQDEDAAGEQRDSDDHDSEHESSSVA